MKLSRNKIRKIRKQQHQSARKWKKNYKSGRRTTFRQSRRQIDSGDKHSSKLDSVIRRTLKKYISPLKLNELKEEYKRLRRQRRKQRQYGGLTKEGEGAVEPQEPVKVIEPETKTDDNKASSAASSSSASSLDNIKLVTEIAAAIVSSIISKKKDDA